MFILTSLISNEIITTQTYLHRLGNKSKPNLQQLVKPVEKPGNRIKPEITHTCKPPYPETQAHLRPQVRFHPHHRTQSPSSTRIPPKSSHSIDQTYSNNTAAAAAATNV